jgi:hypothetical protein
LQGYKSSLNALLGIWGNGLPCGLRAGMGLLVGNWSTFVSTDIIV